MQGVWRSKGPLRASLCASEEALRLSPRSLAGYSAVVSENLDLVRSIVGAWERGDFGSAEWAHADIEYAMIGGVDEGSWRGRTAMAQAWGGWLSVWNELHVEAEDFRELDPERVFVLARTVGRGRTSGVDIAQTHGKGAVLFCVKYGEVTKLTQWWDRERALADLGLKG